MTTPSRHKYRAWILESKEMLPVTCIEFFDSGAGAIVHAHRVYGHRFDESPHNELILMQSTGLTDKDGTEIYEGDVLEFDDDDKRLYRVFWEDGGFWFQGENDGDQLGSGNMEYARVVGNKFANPELLEARD